MLLTALILTGTMAMAPAPSLPAATSLAMPALSSGSAAQAAPPAGMDDLIAQVERIVALAQASGVRFRIDQATKALNNLKAMRDGSPPPPVVGELHGNQGPGHEFALAMSHIAAQAATSKLTPILDILSQIGGPVVMDHIAAYTRANAAFEEARRVNAPSTSRMEQAAEDTRLKIMGDFDKVVKNPAAYRSAAAAGPASPARPGPGPAPAAAPAGASAPATDAIAAAPSLDEFQRTIPSNPGTSTTLMDIKRALAIRAMVKGGATGNDIMNAITALGTDLSKGPMTSDPKSADHVALARSAAVNFYGELYRVAQAGTVRSGGNNAVAAKEKGPILFMLQGLVEGDPKRRDGLQELLLTQLEAAHAGSGAQYRASLANAIRAAER